MHKGKSRESNKQKRKTGGDVHTTLYFHRVVSSWSSYNCGWSLRGGHLDIQLIRTSSTSVVHLREVEYTIECGINIIYYKLKTDLHLVCTLGPKFH